MDILTMTLDTKIEDIFSVAIRSSMSHDGTVELMKYDRVTSYGQYSRCVDPAVMLNLCSCDLNSIADSDVEQFHPNQLPTKITRSEMKVELIRETIECVYLVSTNNGHGIILEVMNMCYKGTYTVTFKGHCDSAVLSVQNIPLEVQVGPFETKLLLSILQKDPTLTPGWKYHIYLHE